MDDKPSQGKKKPGKDKKVDLDSLKREMEMVTVSSFSIPHYLCTAKIS